jgi:hypothetical protein
MPKPPEWSETEKEMLRRYFPTESKESISAMLNRTFDTIRCKAFRMGIHRILGAQWTQEEIDTLHRLYPAGSEKELVTLLHRSFNTISCQAQRFGICRTGKWCRQKLEDRFKNFVMPEPNSGCWLWMGGENRQGYGQIGNGNGKDVRAHRVSWEIHYGPIPDGLDVLHKCDNPPCVNPQHLFLGTPQDNMDDCCKKKRQAYGSRNFKAKLADADVIKIRQDTRFAKEIAISFGVSTNTIDSIRENRTWKHISNPHHHSRNRSRKRNRVQQELLS